MKKSAKSDEFAMKKMSTPLPAASSSTGQGHRFSLAMSSSSSRTHKSDDPGKIFKLIDDNVIGKSTVFLGPFGRRKRKRIILELHNQSAGILFGYTWVSEWGVLE